MTSVPSHPTSLTRPARRRADDLVVIDAIAVSVERVGRPRKRRDRRQPPHVVDLDADVHEAAAVAARQAERHLRIRMREQRADAFAIEPRASVGRQIDAAQCHQRRHRGVEIERRRAVEIEVQLLLVLVLRLQHATAARGGYRTAAEHDAQRDASCDRHDPQ